MTEKCDTRWGRWHLLLALFYVVPGFAVIILVLKGHLPVGLGLAIFLACWTAGVVLDVWRFRNYKCPDCGERLPPPHRWYVARIKPDHIKFYCEKCDVVWRTKFMTPEID